MIFLKINILFFSENRLTLFIKSGLVLSVYFMMFSTIQAKEVSAFKEKVLRPIISFNEVPVEVFIKGYGSIEIDIIITNDNLFYIDVLDLFKKLEIKCVENKEGRNLNGFIENESKLYSIDFDKQQIIVGKKLIHIPNSIVKELNSIFVESTVFTEAFGINMVFNYRSLSIKMDAKFEFPIIKKKRIDKIRNNVAKDQFKSEKKMDTLIGRKYHVMNGLSLDWSFLSNKLENKNFNNRYSLGLGTELLGGEAKIAMNFFNQLGFDRRQLFYNWRWIENDNKYIKQIQIGKIGSQSISFIGAPLVGLSFNNSPNTIRKAKGTYTIRDYTEPNWTVELYINDVLVNYTASDPSGLYEFKVPIVYGYNTLKLKFYGPLGEERTEERIMDTPYAFMPTNVMEYNVTSGILEVENGSKFGRAEVKYGVTRVFTVGGGIEYLSSISNHPVIPFANISFQPFTKMIVNMEFANSVSFKGLLNYSFGQSAFLDIDYANFVKGQQATNDRTNETLKIRVSLPIKINLFTANTQISYNNYNYDTFNFNQINALLSGRYRNYSTNFSLASNWISDKDPYITSTIIFGHRLRNGLTIRPSLQYNVTDKTMTFYRAELEKRMAKMSYSISYERNMQFQLNNVSVNFKYDLPYARTNASVAYIDNLSSFSEGAQGSVTFGGGNGTILTGNNSSLGKGGVLIFPFLDLNQNGIRDKGEKLVLLNSVKVSGGRAIISKKDSIVRISDLNSFINYNIEFKNDDLENIEWKFKHNTYQILVDPNQYKKVDVPILVLGEVNGEIYLNEGVNLKEVSRFVVQIYDDHNKKVAETLSESDGYFSYLGLKPGKFVVKVDDKQLEKLDYRSSPQLHQVTIEVSEDGTIVEGLDFQISTKDTNEVSEGSDPVSPEVKIKFEQKKLLETITPKPIKKTLDTEELCYSIEVGVYKEHSMPKELQNLDTVFYEELADGNLQYYYGFFRTLERAIIAKNALVLSGINGTSIVAYQFGKKIQVTGLTMEKEEGLKVDAILIKTKGQINSKVNISFVKISDQKGIFYSVQIGIFKNFVSSEYLLRYNPVFYELLPDETVRYISGKYDSKKEAKKARNKIISKGVKDAYIVKYNDGEKIDTSTIRN
jgi:hypothetical protein